MTSDQHEQDIVAYLDGELLPVQRDAFEAQMNADPVLAERVRRHAETTALLKAAYPRKNDRMFGHEDLVALGLASPEIADLTAKRAGRRLPRRTIWWTAIAASLGAGIVAGNHWSSAGNLSTDRQGHVIATAELARVLNQEPDGIHGNVRIGMTFRSHAGYCRTFAVSGHYAGLGCRSSGTWQLPIIVGMPADEPQSIDFQLAADTMPPSVMDEVDANIVGEPMTKSQVEQALRARWKSGTSAGQR